MTQRTSPPTGGGAPQGARLSQAMERLHTLLLELVAVLVRDPAPPVEAHYEVEDVGTLQRLAQQDYRVIVESREPPRLALTFRCVGRHPIRRSARTVAEKDQLRERLAAFGLEFGIDDLSSWHYVLTVQPVVPVSLRFEPDAERGSIAVSISNLRKLGTERYSIAPEAVGPELAEELRKLVLRMDNRFSEFSGNRVPETVRARLQERLRARALEREQERRQEERERAAPQGLSATGRLRRMLSAGSARQAASPASPAPPAPRELRDAPSGAGRERSPTAPVAPERASARGKAAAPPEARSGTAPAYAWLISSDPDAEDTAASLGRLGPRGASRRFSVPKVLRTGERFRLLDRGGRVRFTGRIAGEYRGMEPVVDFGMDHDCFVIEYHRAGSWRRVRAAR